MQKLFVATEKFTPSDKSWSEYISWSGLTQLIEVVGLDNSINKYIVPFKNEYWESVVKQDYMINYFTDLKFLRSQIGTRNGYNFIGTIRAPSCDVSQMGWEGFRFLGYELLDQDNDVSALTNCGGFPEAFRNSELSERGLIVDFSRALEIQRDLKLSNPAECHADTNIWAVFRSEETNGP